MPVAPNTVETYDNKVLREDLQEAYSMISPEETPFHALAGSKTVTQPKFDWPVVELAEIDLGNAVIEGDDTPAVDDATLADRLVNYTQISDKLVSVSHTSDASDAAAENIQELAEQVSLKMRELKRDCEAIALNNKAASAGASGTARSTAGFPAFIKSNFKVGTGGAAIGPTLSADPDGFPSSGWASITPVAVTEDDLNDVIQQCWEAGADTSIAMVNSNNKRVISATFTGNSTRYKDAVDRSLSAAIDVYTSDFNELQIVPNRFLPALDNNGATLAGTAFGILLIDPNFVRIVELEGTKQKPLAETGHSRKTLVWREWGVQVDNEEAHGILPATSGAAV